MSNKDKLKPCPFCGGEAVEGEYCEEVKKIDKIDWDDLVGIFNQLYAGYMGWADETYNDEERKWWFE